MTELLLAILTSGGFLGLVSFVSLAVNGILAWTLWKSLKPYDSSKDRRKYPVSIDDAAIEKLVIENFSDQILKIEQLLLSVKKEIEMFSFSEHQPLREMLIKITSSIELLAKTIEYAAKTKEGNGRS